MKEQAWGDIFIHLKQSEREGERAQKREGVCVGKRTGRYRADSGQRRGKLWYSHAWGWERTGLGGLSAPQVFPVADDLLLSSSSTS